VAANLERHGATGEEQKKGTQKMTREDVLNAMQRLNGKCREAGDTPVRFRIGSDVTAATKQLTLASLPGWSQQVITTKLEPPSEAVEDAQPSSGTFPIEEDSSIPGCVVLDGKSGRQYNAKP